MSRRHSKSHSRTDPVQRGPISTIRYTPINRVLHTLNLVQQLESQYASQTRRAFKAPTQRRYHPNPIRPIQTVTGSSARFNHNRLSTLYQSPWQFAEPNKVGICQRRRERREVLHALKRTGKGSRSRRNRTANSDLHCR